MDEGGHENGRHRMEFYNGHTQWNMNMIPQYQMKDHNNVLYMNKRIMHIAAERDAAFEERDRALSERRAAMEERDAVIQQRDRAIAERDNAIKERDNAIAALRFQENPTNNALNFGVQRGSQRMHPITDACPIQAISAEAVKIHQEKRKKQNKSVSSKPPSKKVKRKISEDLNRRVTTDGSKAEWDSMDLGMVNQISFDKTTMPIPVCSCTGVQRACYKWGNGGWQSSCCTTTLSMYPLPQMPNKRHSRMGGRKMSGSVFTRLLTRVAAQGHDLRMPLDLKGYWAKHGTNRYITIQ